MFHLLPHSPAPTGSHTRAAQTGRQAESSTTAAPRPGSAPPFCARLLTARVCSWFGRCPKGRDLSDKVRWAAFCFWISSFTVFFFLHRHHLPFRQVKCGSKTSDCYDQEPGLDAHPIHVGTSSGGWTCSVHYSELITHSAWSPSLCLELSPFTLMVLYSHFNILSEMQ